jgi:hypothetical protein
MPDQARPGTAGDKGARPFLSVATVRPLSLTVTCVPAARYLGRSEDRRSTRINATHREKPWLYMEGTTAGWSVMPLP